MLFLSSPPPLTVMQTTVPVTPTLSCQNKMNRVIWTMCAVASISPSCGPPVYSVKQASFRITKHLMWCHLRSSPELAQAYKLHLLQKSLVFPFAPENISRQICTRYTERVLSMEKACTLFINLIFNTPPQKLSHQ